MAQRIERQPPGALGRIVAAAISDISMPPFVAAQADEHGERAENGLSKKASGSLNSVLRYSNIGAPFGDGTSPRHVSPVQSFRYFIARGQHCQARYSSTEAAEKSRACRRFRSRCPPCGAPTPRGTRRVVCYAKKRPHGHKCVPTAYAAVFRLRFLSHKFILFVSITL